MRKAQRFSAAPVTNFRCMCLLYLVLVTVVTGTPVDSGEKGGRCPEPKMDQKMCGDQTDQCSNDTSCAGDSKCCSTGCSKVCILPSYTACEQARVFTVTRKRSLEAEDAREVSMPECDPVTGRFRDIQQDNSGYFCVDSQGFERPGTRTFSLQLVNCSNPRPCDGPMCRMLCPHGFALDRNGCEICECKNVCKDVKCPSSTECHVEEMHCTTEPCPPIPICKQPRTLESLCQFGHPLMIPESGKPFLCGRREPSCPTDFQCSINRDADYGVCCASSQNFEKSGTCPLAVTDMSSKGEGEKECSNSKHCRHDMDCAGLDKCCISNCGKQCAEPTNSTMCLQQKRVAELLSQKELEGKGYIPQCDEHGNFIPKQCSRNGLICWCVTPVGRSAGQIGSAETVDCSNTQTQRAASSRIDVCGSVICSSKCEFGYKRNRKGCPTCECSPNPCEDFQCPNKSECKLTEDENCADKSSCVKPTCVSEGLFANPCDVGTPLMDGSSGKVVTCSESVTCPGTHECLVVSNNQYTGVCCISPHNIIDSYTVTKPGMCPFQENSKVCDNNCQQDSDCEHDMKCCMYFPGNCTACEVPILQTNVNPSKTSSSMCEYLRNVKQTVRSPLNIFKLALRNPQCKEDGSFEALICDGDHCACIDEFGVQIAQSRINRDMSDLTEAICLDKRIKKDCLGSLLTCRLGCDYGYETDAHGCVVCECRNPCTSHNLCTEDEQCELVDVNCEDGYCLPLPYCIPKIMKNEMEKKSCPQGNMFLTDTNETLACNARARMLQCPDEYFCHELDTADGVGVCCPIIYDDSDKYIPSAAIAQDRYSEDEIILENENDLRPSHFKACQALQDLVEMKARESGVPAKRFFIPQCEPDGAYSSVQCDPVSQFCFCVDPYYGKEIDGTRMPVGISFPNCHRPAKCPKVECSHTCEFGQKKDIYGCPTCHCQFTYCTTECERGQECRLADGFPICLPKVDNICATGAPLTYFDSGERVTCLDNKACPSSHYCNLSLYKEPGLCCQKPKEICFENTGTTHCKEEYENDTGLKSRGTTQFYFFNSSANECQPLPTSETRCIPESPNVFDSRSDCTSVCPALTQCEKSRERNDETVLKYQHLTYIPKCDPETGEWMSIQGFDELGIYFCVNQNGEMIKGTMSNNGRTPNCHARKGRLLDATLAEDPLICEGDVVHKCVSNMCDNQICAAHPTAKCLIDPCGGCKLKWVVDGKEVSCEEGLSKCQRETQTLMNSATWSNHVKKGNMDSLISGSLNVENSILDIAKQENDSDEEIDDSHGGQEVSKTHIEPIYANINGRRTQIGVAASTTFTFGVNPASTTSFTGIPQPHSSITDVLADLLTQGSEHVSRIAAFMDDMIPRRSRVYHSQEELPSVIPFGFNYPKFPQHPTHFQHPRIRRAADEDISWETVEDSEVVKEGRFSSTPDTDLIYSVLRSVVKEGECGRPRSSSLDLLRLLAGDCSSSCSTDVDCPGELKCCLDACGGSKCVMPMSLQDHTPSAAQVTVSTYPSQKPEVENIGLTMIPSLPQCMDNGNYAPVQVLSDTPLSYCVDVEGNPHLHSLTKGMVHCSNYSGIIEERRGNAIVCPMGKRPTICSGSNNKCLHATCQSFTDALCVMDVCEECQPNFYNYAGDKVVCNSEPMECVDKPCDTPMEICKLPPRQGVCRSSMERYYFDSNRNSCDQFIYSGCGGNANNFMTKEECENRCPDVVLCPKIQDGQLQACSRSSVCDNTSCGDLRSHDYYCSVEPCSCTAVFKDLQGNIINCGVQSLIASSSTNASFASVLSNDAFGEETPKVNQTTELSEKKENNSNEIFSNDAQILKIVEPENLETICVSMKRQGTHQSISCDEEGRFTPEQCSWESKSPMCWCVDDVGNQVEGSKTFVLATRSCKRVPIMKVDISLNFPISDVVSSTQMGVEMQDFLKRLNASLIDNKIEVEVMPASTSLNFALEKAENSVDISYWLEQIVKKNLIGVVHGKNFLPADLSASRFHYSVAQQSRTADMEANEKMFLHDDAVSSENLGVDRDYNTVVVLLTLVAAITVILTILGLFFAFQKKKTSGFYPKKTFDSLAFNSQLYEFEKKMPVDSRPMFKAKLPNVQEECTSEKAKA